MRMGLGISLRKRGAVAAAATDPSFSSVKLLMGFEGTNGSTTFTDESASPVTFSAVGTPTITTAQKKFGTSSLDVPGSSYASTPSGTVKWDPAASNFTIEFFARHTATDNGVARAYLSWGTNPTLEIFKTSSNTLQGYLRTASQGSMLVESVGSNSFTPVAGQQYCICLERSGATLRLYLDGVMLNKRADLTGALEGATAALRVGSGLNGGHSGQIDELRITHAARYNSDAGYAVPTAAFPRA